MVSYQPIRLNFEDLPNDFMIKTIAVLGIGLNAMEKKKMSALRWKEPMGRGLQATCILFQRHVPSRCGLWMNKHVLSFR